MSHSEPRLPADLPPDESALANQLLNLRCQPSRRLQQRVQSIPQRVVRPSPRFTRSVIGAAIVALLAVWLLNSAPVQAGLSQVQQVIGQINLTIQEVWPKPTATVAILETELMSLDQARQRIPFDFALPAYIPATLTRLDERIGLANLTIPMVKVEWRDQKGGVVQLSVYAVDSVIQQRQTVVGPDSSEAILINGQEAVLIHGAWDETSRTWQHQQQMLTLLWAKDKVQYRLLAFTSQVPLPELIAMAESIP